MGRSTLLICSEADTDRLGQILARYLPSRIVLGLIGTLGAGKTRLVKALAAAAGVDPTDVQSPTYVLCHEYLGRQRINHWDTYRLQSIDEFLDLGVEDYWDAPGWTIIEWADRVAPVLPDERIDVRITLRDDGHREVELTAGDASLQAVVEQVIAEYVAAESN